MLLQYRASTIWKLIDSISGKIVDGATIEIQPGKHMALNKGGGFYVALNLAEGEYKGTIIQKNYERKEFSFQIGEETKISSLLLIPTGSLQEQEGVVLSGTVKRRQKGNIEPVYYGAFRKALDRRITASAKAGEQFLKMEYGEAEALDYRFAAIEKYSEMVLFSGYSFQKGGYLLSTPLKADIPAGSLATVLQEGTIDSNGKFHVLLGNQYFQTDKKTAMAVFIKGKLYQGIAEYGTTPYRIEIK